MAKILKPNDIALGKLNNSEYTYFSQQVADYITAATAEKLHIDAGLVSSYQANIDKMTDIVAQSRISAETVQIAEVDKQADNLIVYLLGAFRNAKSSPVKAQHEAGTALYDATKPYLGMQRLPQRQEVQKTRGLLADLKKPELAAHVTTLALTEVVEELAKVIDTYAGLLDNRAASQIANKLDAGKTVRTEMDAQYNEITTTVFAFSVAAPADELTEFITRLNKLVDDTKTAYNQRMARPGGKAVVEKP